jgi:hypothetical protein
MSHNCNQQLNALAGCDLDILVLEMASKSNLTTQLKVEDSTASVALIRDIDYYQGLSL